MNIILFTALCFAAYTDIKYRQIEILNFPVAALLSLLTWEYRGYEYSMTYHMAGLFLLTIPTLICCIAANAGGGDLIMFSSIGFILGYYEAIRYSFVLCISISVATLIRYLYCKYKKRLFIKLQPLAPYALMAYILYLL